MLLSGSAIRLRVLLLCISNLLLHCYQCYQVLPSVRMDDSQTILQIQSAVFNKTHQQYVVLLPFAQVAGDLDLHLAS